MFGLKKPLSTVQRLCQTKRGGTTHFKTVTVEVGSDLDSGCKVDECRLYFESMARYISRGKRRIKSKCHLENRRSTQNHVGSY